MVTCVIRRVKLRGFREDLEKEKVWMYKFEDRRFARGRGGNKCGSGDKSEILFRKLCFEENSGKSLEGLEKRRGFEGRMGKEVMVEVEVIRAIEKLYLGGLLLWEGRN